MKDTKSTRPEIGVRFVITVALILIAGATIAAITMTAPDSKPVLVPFATASALPTNASSFDVTAPIGTPSFGGATPRPYEYDPEKDRHWDPAHEHWHPGQPPSATQVSKTGPSIADRFELPPAGGTPAPWTYDAQKDQHWVSDHGHWHPGRPPAGKGGGGQ
jgi:hypothetical protein